MIPGGSMTSAPDSGMYRGANDTIGACRMGEVTCQVDECGRACRGLIPMCHPHRERWRRAGDAFDRSPIRRVREDFQYEVPPDGATTAEWFSLINRHPRFRGRVAIVGDCIEWIAGRNPDGYGAITIDQQRTRTHRVSYRLFRGPIGSGELVIHSCDNRPCVNPRHLRTGSHADNGRDASERGRMPVGERHPKSQLTNSQVREIRERHRPNSPGRWGRHSDGNTRELAEEFGVAMQTITRVAKGRGYRDA